MAIFAGAAGVKIPPAGQPAVDPAPIANGDPTAGTFTKYWYDFLLGLAKSVAAVPTSFSAHKNSVDQTISVAALDQKLTFGTALWNEGGYYSAANSRWTPPAGLVQLTACALVTTANAVDQIQIHISIYKNGSLLKLGDVLQTSGLAANIAPCASVLDKANGADFYEATIAIQVLTAGNRIVSGNPAFTFFQGTAL